MAGEGAGAFGRALRELRPAPRPGRGPWPLERLLARLEAEAGGAGSDLFRRRACPRGVQAVREGLEAGGARGAAAFLADVKDPHLVAGAVKLYLASLPEPLLTFDRYADFLAAARAPGTGLDTRALRDMVRGLPAPEGDAVRLLVGFLKRVRGAADEADAADGGRQAAGRLPEPNLGALFAPLLLRQRGKTWVEVDTRDIHCATAVVGHLIQDADNLPSGGSRTAVEGPRSGGSAERGGGGGGEGGGGGGGGDEGGGGGWGGGGGEGCWLPGSGGPPGGAGFSGEAGVAAEAVVDEGIHGVATSLLGGQDAFDAMLGGFMASAGLPRDSAREEAAPAGGEATCAAVPAAVERIPVPSVAISTARVREMTLEASLQEKSLLKRELKGVDERFAQLTGRRPTKDEKEHLKPLYLRYWKLKKHIEKQRRLAQAGTPLAPLNV